jgi:hypothetical protein
MLMWFVQSVSRRSDRDRDPERDWDRAFLAEDSH